MSNNLLTRFSLCKQLTTKHPCSQTDNQLNVMTSNLSFKNT